MKVFENILCPIDFSDNSVHSLQWAEILAKRFGSKLTVLHVMEYPGATDTFAFDFEAYQARTTAEMNDFVSPLRIPYETLVISGSAAHEIVAQAEKTNVSLIVMATRGLKGAAHTLLGSTTEYVIHHAAVPVLTTCPQCTGASALTPRKRVLLPTSTVEKTPPGYLVLRNIVEELDDAVTMMHVVDFKDPIFGVNYSVHPFNVTAYEAGEKEKRLLEIGESMLANAGGLESVVHFGNPGEEILREISLMKYDFVLMGVKRETLLSRFRETTAYHVLSRSTIPVFTLKVE